MISATPLALTTATLEGAPAGATITARLVDGDETLATVVTVTPKLDASGVALDAYTATFTAPAALPVLLEWLEGGVVVGSEVVEYSLAGVLSGTAAEAVARQRLVAKLAVDMEPALTTTDIDGLLIRARRVDSAGLYPTEAGYVDTWTNASLDAAASEGWEIRAGRCFDDIDFGEDGQRFNEAQRHKACVEMARLYRRGAGSVTLSSAVTLT